MLLPCFSDFFLLYSSEQDSYKFNFINGAAPAVVIVKLQKNIRKTQNKEKRFLKSIF